MDLPETHRSGRPEMAVSATAAVGAAASVFAWAACCVLPLALSLAGFSFAGAALIASMRGWLTVLAVVALLAGWMLHWRRLRMCRREDACRRPSRLAAGLLVAATVLVMLSLVWQPLIEPWILLRLAAGQ